MTREDWSPPVRHGPVGGLVFAGALLLALGAWQMFIGYVVAGGDDSWFAGGYWYRTGAAARGGLGLAVGAFACLIGLALVVGQRRLLRLRHWAAVTLTVAAVSGVNQCFLAPQYPVWSAVALTVDVFIVWAVATHPPPRREPPTEDGIVRLGPRRPGNWHRMAMARRSPVFASKRFVAEHRFDDAAALTYYSVLSIFPGILVLTSLVGMLDRQATRSLLDGAAAVVPAEGMEIIETAVEGLQMNPGTAGILAIVGLLAALWAASNYVGAFMRMLNEVNATDETRNLFVVLLVRLLLTIVVGTLAAACALTAAAGGSVAAEIGRAIGAGGTAVTVWQWVKWPIILVLVVVIVALLYWLAPALRTDFRFRAPGAALAVVLWVVVSFLFGLYVANFGNYNRTYGTLGGVIIFLVWLWLTNAVLLFGAEFNASARLSGRSEEGSAGPRSEGRPEVG